MTNFEKLKKNEELRKIYSKILKAYEKYPHLCFSERKLRDIDYYEGVVNDTTRNRGRINIIDLPEDLGLKDLVINRIKLEYERLQREFDSYVIKK